MFEYEVGQKEIRCSRCNKLMTHSDGTNLVGLSITFKFGGLDEEYKKFYKKQLGKYAENKDYNFCFECWIDSLMGRR